MPGSLWGVAAGSWDGLAWGAARVEAARIRSIKAPKNTARFREQIPCEEIRCNIAAPHEPRNTGAIGLLRKISKLLAGSQLPGSAVKSSSFSLLVVLEPLRVQALA